MFELKIYKMEKQSILITSERINCFSMNPYYKYSAVCMYLSDISSNLGYLHINHKHVQIWRLLEARVAVYGKCFFPQTLQ